MSITRLIFFTIIISMSSTTIGLLVGIKVGKPFGYAVCVSESDDDYIRTWRF